jgi:hypothetical protein
MKSKMQLVLLASCLFLMTAIGQAQYHSNNSVKIKFSSDENLSEVTWEPRASLTNNGLFIEKMPSDRSAEIWVATQPIPVGLSFRPATSVNVNVLVEAVPNSFSFLRSHFRYSCDRVHWSTWYNLSEKKTDSVYRYSSWVSIPNVAQKEYSLLARDWLKTSPAWSSDEHALCEWIAKNNPKFFATEFPFIGYIQIRLEGETQGMRLHSITVNTDNSVSGLTSVKKGKVRDTINEKWFFDLSKITK